MQASINFSRCRARDSRSTGLALPPTLFGLKTHPPETIVLCFFSSGKKGLPFSFFCWAHSPVLIRVQLRVRSLSVAAFTSSDG
jgi:hypothetical protein